MITLLSLFADEVFKRPETIVVVDASGSLFTTILKVVFTTAGIIAVLMITIGGFEYVISQGDPQRTAKAKNTILYAIIGLVIAISGFTIVTFILGRLT